MDSPRQEVEAIRRRMELLRAEVSSNVSQVTVKTRELTDWRTYVHRYPVAVASLAAAAGFLVLGRMGKRSPLMSPAIWAGPTDSDTAADVTRLNPVTANTSRTLQQLAMTFVARQALQWISQRAAQAIAHSVQKPQFRDERAGDPASPVTPTHDRAVSGEVNL